MKKILSLFVFLLLTSCVYATETVTTDFLDIPEVGVATAIDGFPPYDPRAAFVTPDGLSLLVALPPKRAEGGGGEISVVQWGLKEKKIVKTASIKMPIAGIADSGLSADGRVLVVGFISGKTLCWDTKTGKTIELQPLEKLLGNVAVAADGRNIVTSGVMDNTVKETSLSVKENHPVRPVVSDSGRSQCMSLAYSPDGTMLAASIGDVILWDAKTLEKKWNKNAHRKATRVVFSPDSRTLLSIENNEKVVLWNPETGEQEFVMKGNAVPFTNASFSKDGKRLATVGYVKDAEQCWIIVWDMETKKAISRFALPEDVNQKSFDQARIVKAEFLPDGNRLVVFGKKPFVLDLEK